MPVLTFQLFDGAVEQKVRPDFEPLGHGEQHGQRGLPPSAFEEGRVRARDTTAKRKLFLGQVFAFPYFLENLAECHRCLAIASHRVTMLGTGLVLYGR